ncbi:inorganic diphosphatase [Algoriphagus boritolerans]|uniref:inorganic diphosphatase n=1 Tax=Algoriphagus boritolerans DSM 17298 = JCM 18970 TaxID=1120964 RepID=A0A1H5V5M7_9BACT|nr:inorganic diphosphatase [Algoriphagus boritolerans]SEF82496.1 inorganic pyrophosphatase [Algoriphagus boritolerans DSM 17298 = JCM 18970]
MKVPIRLILTFLILSACSGEKPHLVNDIPSYSKAGFLQAVVEIPAGTTAKYEVDKVSGKLVWSTENGLPRDVAYLGYPGNYGFIPQTLSPKETGGDGDPLDVIILGPAVERGIVIEIRLIGALKLKDRGEQDDKLIAVPIIGAFERIASLDQLEAAFPGALEIIQLWFENYKGPGMMVLEDVGETALANKILTEAENAFKSQ